MNLTTKVCLNLKFNIIKNWRNKVNILNIFLGLSVSRENILTLGSSDKYSRRVYKSIIRFIQGHSFILLFIYLFIYLIALKFFFSLFYFIHSFFHSFINLFIFINSFIYFLIHLFIYSFSHSFILHSLFHPFIFLND